MIHLRRTVRAGAVALLAGLVLAGCANAPTPPESTPPERGPAAGPGQAGGHVGEQSEPTTPMATAPPTEPPSPTEPGAPAEQAAPVRLPWPAGGADAAALQAAADNGAQPWLLDPSEVAISYARAAHGWTDAEAYPGPAGTSVDVRNAGGERLTLTLVQPARTGDDGIWVVTAEQPA